ncbi:MAG: peptidoglycan DD-metalloendopeptidase family protein [Thermodesulfobacteriota bacterium]|nr:peptidoglycan DD-metalloendopeptidase family protein [Thermodesulfobacteriota bacterium]
MAKKDYTILIISQQAAKVKKFILSPLTLKIGAAVLGILIVVSAFMVYNYITFQKKVSELHALRAETNSQQEEIRSFMEKITLLEKQLDKLKEMEKQVAKDLKEVSELKKNIKTPPKATKKKTSLVKKEEVEFKENLSFREEEVSVLDKERNRLVSRMHQDLLELHKEFSQREQNFKELKEFLQAQKSILLATPSLWPVIGRISSGFGDTRLSSSSGGTRPHMGIDIPAPSGTPVVAPADGLVSFAGREAEYGRLICLDHGHGYSTMFGHLKDLFVQTGDKVKRGQTIGTVGTSGKSTGPHLHYEVRFNGNPVNPARYLNQSS